jgi:pimeloyl-ACP methyl ester carboxylesterase
VRTKANGIEIEYETFGKKSDPALLLIMGLGAQLTLWPEALCTGLAERGFFVVRYDNRDCGLSSDFGAAGVPDIAGAVAKLMQGKKVEAP